MAGGEQGQVEQLADWLRWAKRAVAFTGAGISTECGIPDFRSPGGIWTRMQPIDFRDYVTRADMRREAWRRKREMQPLFAAARPGAVHRLLADLIARGRLKAIVTQNIDNLHQTSGVPEERIIELHGNGSYAHCLSCGVRYEQAWIDARMAPDFSVPDCEACGGLIKTATISFGQPMPAEAMRRATLEAETSDLFVVLGSSLVVYPAAGLPITAKRHGARLVIVNREPTELDDLADLVINAELGAVAQSLAGHLAPPGVASGGRQDAADGC
ncbi:MAG: Sir2 family NAD-dependent protein deacetylase [Hyphomicrobiaceae bacterium]